MQIADIKLRCMERSGQAIAALTNKVLVAGLAAPVVGYIADYQFGLGSYGWTLTGVGGLLLALAYNGGIRAAIELLPMDNEVILDVLAQAKEEPKA